MIKSVQELKDLILWAKEQRISEFHINDVKITFSPLAFVDALSAQSDAEMVKVLKNLGEDTEDEEILFHSARP